MSERPDEGRGPWWVAPFAAVTYVALVVCAFGFISLFADLDVVADPEAGPLTGPLMVVVATIVVAWVIVRETRRLPLRVSIGTALLAGLLAWFGYGVSGGVFAAIAARDLAGAAVFAASTLVAPFSITAGLLAVAVVLGASTVAASSLGHPSRPRWPWERDES
ncbi:hypothetical protein KXS11_00885 [Plantibacter flavus]|uniref:DUF6121 family protein n=1 Tax=Plantibacter flavus TaxID=150123 RepID=UPI003F176F08